jgi:hypothetical protein
MLKIALRPISFPPTSGRAFMTSKPVTLRCARDAPGQLPPVTATVTPMTKSVSLDARKQIILA